MSRKRKNKHTGRILVCPLDWGLGHATRCIPIIDILLEKGHMVILASNGRSLELLRNEYPHLPSIELPDYRIRYPKNGRLIPTLIRQIPHMIRSILTEYFMIKKAINQYKATGLISDNRFGVLSQKVPSAYMSHQIYMLAPNSIKWVEPLLFRLHQLLLTQYDEVWIPDFKDQPNLSGKLSHLPNLPSNVHYIGALSRLKKTEYSNKKYDIMAIVSGPETQRTTFEEILVKQLKDFPGKHLLVQGLPNKSRKSITIGNVEIVNHLNRSAFNEAIHKSKHIISRSGYSTIMDLAALGKSAILVPTPGQTEQEYLSRILMKNKCYYSVSQSKLDIKRAISKLKYYTGINYSSNNYEVLCKRIERLFD